MQCVKECSLCGETKPLTLFHKNPRATDGHKYRCAACCSAARRAWYVDNKDHAKAYAVKYHEANRARQLAKTKEWREANLPRRAELERLRKAARKAGSLKCVSREALQAVYERAAHLTMLTGVPHHVDHEIPLKGRQVCGLHVPWNLRCIPAAENKSKGNRI